jgi:hypothetical protein
MQTSRRRDADVHYYEGRQYTVLNVVTFHVKEHKNWVKKRIDAGNTTVRTKWHSSDFLIGRPVFTRIHNSGL